MQKRNIKIAQLMSVMAFAFIMLFTFNVNAQNVPGDSITVVNPFTGEGESRQASLEEKLNGEAGTVKEDLGFKRQPSETRSKKSNYGRKSNAGLFSHLAQKASEIFMGLREIIYVVAAFGILGVAIGGFFGNINWKWFGAIAIGLMVIAVTSSLIKYLIGSDSMTYVQITDSMK